MPRWVIESQLARCHRPGFDDPGPGEEYSVEVVGGAVRAGGPGRYHVDEISTQPLPSGHTSRRWGTAIKRPDGAVTLDPDPWPDR
jgi:hypothetical protein